MDQPPIALLPGIAAISTVTHPEPGDRDHRRALATGRVCEVAEHRSTDGAGDQRGGEHQGAEH